MPHEYVVRNFRLAKDSPEREADFAQFREMDLWVRAHSTVRTLLNYKAALLDMDTVTHMYWSIFPVINRERWCREHRSLWRLCEHNAPT